MVTVHSICIQATSALLSSRTRVHSGRVYKIVESATLGIVASASEDLTMIIWSSTTLELLKSLPLNHSVMLRAIATVADDSGENLWTGDAAGMISSWKLTPTSLATHAQSIVLPFGESVCSMIQVQDGGVVIGSDGTILKLAPSLRQLHRRPQVHRGKISCIVTAQEDLIIAASEDYSISIWSLTLEQLHRITHHTGKIHALCVYNDAFLLSGGFDLSLCVYDLRSRLICGKKVWAEAPDIKLTKISTDSISTICVNRSGCAYVASRDGSVQVFRLDSRLHQPNERSQTSEVGESSLKLTKPRSASPSNWQNATPHQLLVRGKRTQSPGH